MFLKYSMNSLMSLNKELDSELCRVLELFTGNPSLVGKLGKSLELGVKLFVRRFDLFLSIPT